MTVETNTNSQTASSDSTGLHVIVGAGATGTATASLLAARGARVRIITRSGSGPNHPNIERIAADASDADHLAQLATGAVAIYNCANPPYHKWNDAWPPLAASLLGAAERTGAVLVTLSNLYGYTVDGPMRSDQPLQAPSKKGAVRAQMWHDALAAHDAGRARVVEVRASDFIGPGIGDTAHMGDRLLKRIVAGKSVQVFGATDVKHSWTAVADVARTLVAVAEEPAAWGRAWHVPTAEPQTQAEMVAGLCNAAGIAPVKVGVIPPALLKVAGVFVAPIREMHEMRYQFVEEFVIDSSETTATFGIEPTPLAETFAAMVAHARGVDAPVPVAA